MFLTYLQNEMYLPKCSQQSGAFIDVKAYRYQNQNYQDCIYRIKTDVN